MSENPSIILKKWVLEFSDELYSWAYYKTSLKEVSEDLVQDTFISAFENFSKFQHNSTPKTWLFSILNNKIIDFYRKKSKNFIISSDEYLVPIKTTDDFFDENGQWKETPEFNEQHWLDNPEFNLILSGCIKNLPDNWQFIIQSKYILDKNGTDICQELQISSSNYWQIIHRAKLLLRKCIELNWVSL